MKIGIDIRLIGKNETGSEVFIFNLVKNLARIDDKNEYVLLTDNSDAAALENIAVQLELNGKNNFKIVSLPTVNRFSWNFWTLAQYLRKNPVDVYHTQYITPWFVPKTVKIVSVVHDISFNYFPQFIKFSDLFFLKMLIPLSLERADRVVGVSEFTKEEIIKYYKINPEKVACVFNAVSEDFLASDISEANLQSVKIKYNLPEKFILYVGTLQPRKNIPQLLEAFARIKNDVPDTKLVVAGNRKAHNYDRQIDEVLEKNLLSGDVIFPGFISEEDKAAVFHLAHVFVFPSYYEGFGIPVLEAMSQKVPIICSNIPSLKEVAKRGAIFFEIGNIADFSKKLYNICVNQDLRDGLILTGRDQAGSYSWQKNAVQMLAIYKEIGNN